MAIEVLEIENWIYTTLKNDSSLATALATAAGRAKDYQIGIYGHLAPEKDPISKKTPQLPFVVFSRVGSDRSDEEVLCGATYLTHPLYRVTVWNSASGNISFGSIKSIASSVDSLLHNKTNTVNGILFHSTRYDTEQPIIVQQDGRIDFGITMLYKFTSLK